MPFHQENSVPRSLMGIGCPAAALWLERVQLGTFRWMCPLLILDCAWFCSNRFLYLYTTQNWYMKNIPELWFGHMFHLHFCWHFLFQSSSSNFLGWDVPGHRLGFQLYQWNGLERLRLQGMDLGKAIASISRLFRIWIGIVSSVW